VLDLLRLGWLQTYMQSLLFLVNCPNHQMILWSMIALYQSQNHTIFRPIMSCRHSV